MGRFSVRSTKVIDGVDVLDASTKGSDDSATGVDALPQAQTGTAKCSRTNPVEIYRTIRIHT